MATFQVIDGYPTYQIGHGPEPLVIIPGLSDAFQPLRDSTLTRILLEHYYYRSYRDEYTLYVISRRRDLDDGTTTRDMARGYAEVIERLDAPVHIQGLSMGGLIGQYFAADYPELVDRFVCVVAGVRCSDRGKEIIARWRNMAERGNAFDIYRDSIPVTYGEGPRSKFYQAFFSTVGDAVIPKPANPHDIVIQAQACLDHDATDILGEIDVPTLVVGGEHDPIFPPDILEQTAAGMKDARLEILANAAHGAFEQRKKTFDSLVQSFLVPETEATL